MMVKQTDLSPLFNTTKVGIKVGDNLTYNQKNGIIERNGNSKAGFWIVKKYILFRVTKLNCFSCSFYFQKGFDFLGRLIAICGKGGKSTIAVNLAYMVSDKNVTLIFDTKVSCSNIGYMLNTRIADENNFNKIILSVKSNIDIKDGIVQHKDRSNLFLLSVAEDTNWLDLTGRNGVISPDKIKEIIFELKNRFDYIVVDCEHHPSNLFSLYSMMYADKIVNVFSPDVFGIAETKSFLPFLCKFDKSRIVNVANSDRNFIGLSKFENLSGTKIDICLPYEFRVQKCSNQGVPIMATTIKCGYTKSFKELMKLIEIIKTQ